MATDIFDSLTDHSPLDGTNDEINGAEVDANPNTLGKILDGTTATDLATDSTVDFRFTSARAGLRAITTDNAAGSVYYGIDIEWDPGDAANMTDGSSGIGMRFLMPDDGDTQTAYGRIYCLMVDDAAAGDDAEFVFETAVGGTLTVEVARFGANGTVFNDDSSDLDFTIESNNIANMFDIDGGLDTIGIGTNAVDDQLVTISPPATTHTATTDTFSLHIGADGAQTIPAGTTTYVGSVNIAEPNITATGTVTNAFTLRIADAPTEGTNNYAFWVDAGASRFDGAVTVSSTLTVGVDDTGHDVQFFGATSGRYLLWDESADTLQLADNTRLTFGTGNDADIYYDGTNLYIEPQTVGSGDVIINDPATLFINETANGNMTIGVTINQGANDNQIMAFKSSDVVAGTLGAMETDDFAIFDKAGNTGGGFNIKCKTDSGIGATSPSFILNCYSDDVFTESGKTTGDRGIIELYPQLHDSAGTAVDAGANINIFQIRTRKSGGNITVWLLDEDGDYFYDGADGGAFDFHEEHGALDDRMIFRSFQLETTGDPKTLVRSHWDSMVKYDSEFLMDIGLLGRPEPGKDERGLVNGAQFQRISAGAHWQSWVRDEELGEGILKLQDRCDLQQEKIESLEAELRLLKG
jgi:hypothetical protein